jgi:hypothetical protein
MKPLRAHHIRFEALLLSAVYFIVVLGHLFPAPCFGSGSVPGHDRVAARNSEKNTELIYNLIRTDRCPWSGDKTVKTPAKNIIIVSSAFARPVAAASVAVGPILAYHYFSDHHFTYLSNRSLRI